jgi:hypothetical protein
MDLLRHSEADRCDAWSESFGRCSLRQGHDGIHTVVSAEEEINALREQLRGAVEALREIRELSLDEHWDHVERVVGMRNAAERALSRLGGQ